MSAGGPHNPPVYHNGRWSKSDCIHNWVQTQSRTGDSHRCVACGKGIRCTCALHFNAFSPAHAEGCQMRRKLASR